MGKKYFAGLANMNDKDLRANYFYHSSLIFFEADTDENDHIIAPLRVIDSYGFYSHNIPEKKSFLDEPFTYLCQQVGLSTRLRGSFGEWRRENIHDLSYGRGLSVRLFEKIEDELFSIISDIQDSIKAFSDFLSQEKTLKEQEKRYKEEKLASQIDNNFPEFNFSLTSNGHVCKRAAINKLAGSYKEYNAKIAKELSHLLGYDVVASLPRFTPGLDDLIIHALTDKWETKGNQQKYPFCEWENAKSSVIVVACGGKYVDLQGNIQTFLTPPAKDRELINGLKTIGRICEMNIGTVDFQKWHRKICHYLYNLASCESRHQQEIRAVYAERFLAGLMNDSTFLYQMHYDIPPVLHERVMGLKEKYCRMEEAEEVRMMC